MKSLKYQIILILVIFTLISVTWAEAKAVNEKTKPLKESKLFVTSAQGTEINKDTILNSINKYQSLSEDKKIAIKARMTELSQKRQKDIEQVEKQINEFKLKRQLQNNNQDKQISQLQAVKKIAEKENATETAKTLEILISWYQNKQKINSLDDNKVKIE